MMSEQVAKPHEATSGLWSQLVLIAPIVTLFIQQWVPYFRNKRMCFVCLCACVCYFISVGNISNTVKEFLYLRKNEYISYMLINTHVCTLWLKQYYLGLILPNYQLLKNLINIRGDSPYIKVNTSKDLCHELTVLTWALSLRMGVKANGH